MKYDSAYSTVRSIMLDLKDEGTRQITKSIRNNTGFDNNKLWESPYKRMQLYLRPFLALLIIIEKERSDGITVSNLRRNIKDYCDFLEIEELFPSREFRKIGYREFTKNKNPNNLESKADHKRIQTLLSDYYQNVGSILFFKNRIYKSLHDEYSYFLWQEWLKILPLSPDEEKIEVRLEIMEEKGYYTQLEKVSKKCYDYVSLSKIKEYLDRQQGYFHPSYSAFSYYMIALGHILIPYIENILRTDDPNKELEENDLENFDQFEMLDKLAMNPEYVHVINGGQQFNLAVISSKLGDSVLGSTSKIDDFNLQCNSFQELIEFPEINLSGKELNLKDLFSLNTILFFYTRAYKLFDKSGFYFDALFQLKKILYILRSHKNSKIGFTNLAKIISDEAKEYARKNELCIKSMKKDLYREVYNINKREEPFANSFLLESTDIVEIRILCASINESLDNSLISDLESNIPIIRSIYIKIQTLRYIFDDKVKQVSHSRAEQENILSIFALLQNYIKTYGFNYIMSYTYYASLCDKMSFFLEKYDSNLDKKINFRDLRVEAIEYYNKSLRLHSEGKEYKTFMQQMYVLDDDFNDTLVHFSAAVERSLMNNGFINSRIFKLNEKLSEFLEV